MFEFELPERFRRYVPLTVWLVVVLVFLAIPLQIIKLGYLPADDALRHVAKAVSGKSWPEILVVGDSYKIDQSLGWHGILGGLHHALGWNAEALVIFSVVGLFLVANCAMLPWLKRPEAWLAAMLAAMVVSDLLQRLMLGRPFILTMTVLMTLLFAVQYKKPDWKMFVLMTVLTAACTYIHGVWYLWLLPIASVFFAGKFRWSFVLVGAWMLGTVISMLLSGHPADYLGHALNMALNGVGGHLTNRTEATELQPFGGDILAVILMGGVVALRLWNKPAAPAFTRNPAFWLMLGCWILGFRVGRFWEDWGWPALVVLMAMEVELLMVAKLAADSLRRLFIVLILGVATFACVTSDLNGRYTQSLSTEFLSAKEHPELKEWMPEKGGILYSADMTIFYQTFFKNPDGDWRYQLGFEPALMPKDDFETYHKILWNGGDVKAYAPWVQKMKPADRLVIRGGSGQHPNIPQLEWYYGATGTWIGRLPQSMP